MNGVLQVLDNITKETNELEKYARINYTGFLKAVKKHDRKRGGSYRIRPLLQVRLSALPFNKEDYSPLLYRLSAMYSFIRQHMDGGDKIRGLSMSEPQEQRKNIPPTSSGSIPTTCSKSRLSSSGACLFLYTTLRRPRLPKVASRIHL